MKLYLDANAHVPLSKAALAAQASFTKSDAAHGHPSSPSATGRAAAAALEDARAKIAKLINAPSAKHIIFTNSCTQACEWVMKMLTRAPSRCYISPVEHPAVTQGCVAAVGQTYGKLYVNERGEILPALQLLENPGSIACIHMQNEIGTIHNVRGLKRTYPNAKVFSDISQSLGKIPVCVKEMLVDFATAGGHKFGGPSGIGFLYIKDLDDWIPFGSGSRYFMDIPGTPNVEGAVMMAAALEEAIQTLEDRTLNMSVFQVESENRMNELGFEVIGGNTKRSPNTTFVKTPCNALELMLSLGAKGIHCGLGSACGSLYTGGSPLMTALGRPSDGQEYLRFSQWGEYDGWSAHYLCDKIEEML